jgi:hypothetical protein
MLVVMRSDIRIMIEREDKRLLKKKLRELGFYSYTEFFRAKIREVLNPSGSEKVGKV